MIKRLFDLTASTTGLLVLSPVLAGLALAVRVKLGSPVFFRQVRPGLHGRPFTMLKFRTMRDVVDDEGNLLPDSQRMTPFGSFLRSSSLDELPELWNVLRGDMSLVGPRPLLMRYLSHYTEREWRRHLVRPGITGWAQINGRNAVGWDERLELDVWYVENQSFKLDIKILLLTLARVLNQEGVVVDPRTAMRDLDEERTEAPIL